MALGLLYGRFSRPVARILFYNALIAPCRGFTAFAIRIANKNRSELLDPEATIVMSYINEEENGNKKNFVSSANLKLNLRIALLTMSWTIPYIQSMKKSPIYNWSEEDILKSDVEGTFSFWWLMRRHLLKLFIHGHRTRQKE
ncbi:MAG: hypothetical protein IPN88_19270 [Bacteroidetes bacterium]|nr:hypothetical protein [Bacteroidota bacterium]